MGNSSYIPSLEDVQQIASTRDPVIRNLRITQCYHELSEVFTRWMGTTANWCTFATWASKQAGQTIRKEDLASLFESRLKEAMARGAEGEISFSTEAGGIQLDSLQDMAFDVRNFSPAVDRASEAVGRGNKKVFEEIGREFARFYQTCLRSEKLETETLDRFCDGLRPGDPPEGQRYLRQAFTHYFQALGEKDPKSKAEKILLANIEIGYHEQTRLQPEIAESLDAGLFSSFQITRQLIVTTVPFGGWVSQANFYLRRLLGRPTRLDMSIQAMLAQARLQLRLAITEVMMAISLPSGVMLRLGEDLADGFPAALQEIQNPELKALLDVTDPTPDSPVDSGAIDWANLPDRLHFIVELFRRYQENAELLTPPYDPEQVEALKAGRLPEGKL